MIPTKKMFFQMTPAEREADVRRYDKGVDLDKTRPLSAKGRLLWERARRGRPPKPAGEKSSRVLITLEPALLAQADRLARSQGLSRSELIARGIRSVIAATGTVL
ncbi:MAG: CopG family transcriptional regulator [Tepidisphaeraceae bacterium]|jgi:hypothetical protein